MSLKQENIVIAQSPEEQAALEAEAIKTEDVKKDPERQQKSTPGVGTDIFVRKKRPGSQVGKGYFVDIYENGVKIDTIELATKKDVTKLIKKFKDKYNTDRAFQNEMQVHITYKTKKERGEPTMASIDTILIKKAHKIQELLNKLTEPELPLIKRFGQEELSGDVTSVPETPPTGTEDKETIKRYIADEIIKKFTEFVKKKIETESGPIDESNLAPNMANHQTKHRSAAVDDIFNPLRKWYSTLSQKIEEWNNMSGNMLNENDIKDIVQQSETIILSQDPNLIQKNTGIAISPETASLMYEVGSKSVGKPGEAEKGGELGGNPADFQDEPVPKAAKFAKKDEKTPTIENTNDLLQSFTKNVQTQISSMAISDIAKDLNVVDNDILQNMHSILSEKDNLVESEAAIKQYIEDQLGFKRESNLHPSIIESETKEFWKFAGDYKGIANIEDVFIDWLKKTGCDLKKAANIWEQVDKDIKNIFNFIEKKAETEWEKREKEISQQRFSLGDIFYFWENRKTPILSGYLEYYENNIVFVPYTDSTGLGYKAMTELLPQQIQSFDISTAELAFEATPNILKNFVQPNSVEYIMEYLIPNSKSPSSLRVTIKTRSAIGDVTNVQEEDYYFNVGPYGTGVTPR
jgi:molybdopterin converting factor small subunit